MRCTQLGIQTHAGKHAAFSLPSFQSSHRDGEREKKLGAHLGAGRGCAPSTPAQPVGGQSPGAPSHTQAGCKIALLGNFLPHVTECPFRENHESEHFSATPHSPTRVTLRDVLLRGSLQVEFRDEQSQRPGTEVSGGLPSGACGGGRCSRWLGDACAEVFPELGACCINVLILWTFLELNPRSSALLCMNYAHVKGLLKKKETQSTLKTPEGLELLPRKNKLTKGGRREENRKEMR